MSNRLKAQRVHPEEQVKAVTGGHVRDSSDAQLQRFLQHLTRPRSEKSPVSLSFQAHGRRTATPRSGHYSHDGTHLTAAAPVPRKSTNMIHFIPSWLE